MAGINSGFVAIVTMALGIGANTAIFSVVHLVLLRDLPYPDAQQLVSVYAAQPANLEPFVFVADAAVDSITRFNGGLMALFGIVDVLIGAAGVYAVMGSFVAQQTREIGVRMALGATPSRIQQGVLALAWRHLVIGLALGLPLGWWLSRGFAALLFQVTPADVSVYAGVAAILCVAGFMAARIPARRASKIDPIISLRS